MAGFLAARNEADLFMVATAFGLGFSGVIPAYVLAVRQLFPAAEAARRIPVLLLCSGSGMAAGGSLGGVMYAGFGFYAPAFATGIAFNLANLPPPGRRTRRPPAAGWRPTRRPALGARSGLTRPGAARRRFQNALALLARPRRQQVGDTGAARPIFPGAHRRGRVRLERRPANPRRDLAL